MIPVMDRQDALAALMWQIELGADEAIGDEPIDRFAAPAPAPEPAASPSGGPDMGGVASRGVDPGQAAPVPAGPADGGAGQIAAACGSLEELRAAMDAFEGCALKKGARSTVFADGMPQARVMIVGEAPGREEDAAGKPFVGASGQLLDQMLAAIGLSRSAETPEAAVYITNVLPWRPPQNRDPSSDEMVMMSAFLERHIALAAPQVLVTMGNAATKTLLQTATGITRMRGKWATYGDVPVLPMFHPAALLRNPLQKRAAWADLLALKARLGS